jgi:hypothetical protein
MRVEVSGPRSLKHAKWWVWQLMPAIPNTQGTKIGKSLVQIQPRQKVSKTLSQIINPIW